MKKRDNKKQAITRSEKSVPVWVVFAILFIVTLAAYANAFKVPFVFDDMVSIQANGPVRLGEFDWRLLRARSILYLTFTLNSIWTGQEVWSYHLINFLLHLVNGLLIFLVAERLFRCLESIEKRVRLYAALAAAFFLVHPVQTESVTYLSSRSELLSTFFYLAAFLIFVFWPRQRVGFFCSLAVAVPFFFGVGSKETATTLPATLFVTDFLFWSGGRFRPMLSRWRFYLTYLLGAGAAGYFVLRVAQRGLLDTQWAGRLSPLQYLATQLRVIVHYVQLIFLPVGLNLDYDFRPSTNPLEPSVIASFVFLGGIAFLGWMLRRRGPVFAFSIFWFFITLSPTSTLVPLPDLIFEHRLYLPLAGVCLSFPLLVEAVYERLRRRVAIWGTAFGYSAFIIAALIVGTIVRNYTWGDEVRLFTDVVAKSPAKERGYNALGLAYYRRGEYAPAIAVLEKGLGMVPAKVPDFSDSLGNFYLKVGRFDDAVALFKNAIPNLTGERLANGYNNLGVAYLYKWNDLRARRDQMREADFLEKNEQILKPAEDAFYKSFQMNSQMSWVLDSYINVTCYRGKGNELEATALSNVEQSGQFRDLYTVGKVAFNRGDYAKADEYFERAEQQNQNEKIVFFNHGYALVALKQDDRAAEKYLQAIRLDPVFIEAHNNLGLIYMRRHDSGKARDAFAEVLRFDPNHVMSNLNLASIYISEGNKELARNHLATVLKESPGNQEATAMLRQIGL